MNATGAAMLKDPSPCGHIVYPYVDSSQFIGAVCLFVETGLQRGESALLLIEESHLDYVLEHWHETPTQPRGEFRSGLIGMTRAINRNENVLRQFLRNRPVGHHPGQKIDHWVPVAIQQLGSGAAGSACQPTPNRRA